MQEKRIFPRIDCPEDKSCTIESTKVGEFYGQLKNLSRTGASIVSKDRLDDKRKLEVVIKYPDIDRNMYSIIEIVWSRLRKGNYTYGGRLVSINNEDKFDLLDYFYESWKNGLLNNRR